MAPITVPKTTHIDEPLFDLSDSEDPPLHAPGKRAIEGDDAAEQ